jgi:hypothetical protein
MSDETASKDVSSVTEQAVAAQDVVTEASRTPNSEVAQRNFKELERRKNEAERRAQELEARLLEIERAKQSQPDEFDSLADDDTVEAKHLKKLKREIEALKNQKKPALSEEDIARIKYRDYDEYVSDETVETHLLSNPALAQMVRKSDNPYEAAYQLLKKLHTPTTKKSEPDLRKKLEEVSSTPRSLNEAGAKNPSASMGTGNTIAEIEARQAAALKRAQNYLGGNY